MKNDLQTSTPRLMTLVQRPSGLMLVASMFCVMLGGCELLGLSGSDQPAQPTGQQTNTPPAAPPVAPPPAIPEESPEEQAEKDKYKRPNYPGNVRRNPFQPVPGAIAPSVTVTTEDKNRRIDPAERYELGQMQLVGIISETVVPKAMFVDPEGMGHILKEGDRIGRQGSVITDIRLNEVDIRETTGEDESTQSAIRVLRLVDYEIANAASNKDSMSDAEKKALDRLLKTEEGRKAVRDSLRDKVDAPIQGKAGASPQAPAPGALSPPSARGTR